MFYRIKKTGEPVEVKSILKRRGCPVVVETVWNGFYERRDLQRISQDEFYRLDDLMAMREVG